MMTDTTDLTEAVSELIVSYGQTRDEMVQVLTTPPDGGENGDGKVEVTLPNGSTVTVDSVAGAFAYVDRVAVEMAKRLIDLQTMVVNRWNSEDE